ncbi:MAG: ABC transporter ATP-binding protein [Clostridia bacterium]|nr:ABC transporter ATP-binding protein [Clostridia bacterium]
MEKAEGVKKAARARGALRYITTRLGGLLAPLILLSFMMAAVSVLSVSMALFMKRAIDSAVSGKLGAMWTSLALMAGVTVLGLALKFISKALLARLDYRMEMRLRRTLLESILTRDLQRISAYHSGDIMNRLTNDISVISAAASGMLPRIFELIARIAFAFGILISFDWFFALLALGGAAMIAAISLLLRPALKRLHKRMQETEGDTRAFMQETIENQLVVRVFGVGERMLGRGDEFMERGFKAAMKRRWLSIFAGEGMSFIFAIGVLAALCWGTMSIAGVFGPERVITYGTLAAVLQLVSQVQAPFAAFAGMIPQFFAMTASCERLMELEDIPGEPGAGKAEGELCDFDSARISGLSFSYRRDGEGIGVFDNASAEIRRGDFVAVTGISGIGKSTLMKLLLGVYSPDSGSVEIISNGRAFPASPKTRSLFAYVPQGNLLLSGTVRENIAFFDTRADDERIMRAARIACAEEFIKELPEGLDTRIGEHGHGLSEGQAQRLSIARAILKNAPVLLLDEATSALDQASEERLLANLRGSDIETVIIITHKTAALSVCGKELTVEGGKLKMHLLR